MKIALVQDWLTGFGGGEQVLLALHRLYPDAPIYTSLYKADRTPQFAGADVRTSYLQRLPGMLSHEKLAIPLMPAAFERFDLRGYDAVISVGGGFSKGVVTHPGQAHVTYCHTPIRYVWRYGGDDRNAGRWDSGLREMAAHRLRLWDVVSAARPDVFLTNSTAVQARIATTYRRESTVVPVPVDLTRFTPAAGDGGYFLSVGRLVGYKRTDILIDAAGRAGVRLKIVGGGPDEARLRALADEQPGVELLGRVGDEELRLLYAGATAFLFAAEEDAGIVPVEAMASGKAVIAYGAGGVLDLVEDGITGILCPEQSAASFAEGIRRFEKMEPDLAALAAAAARHDVELFKSAVSAHVEAAAAAAAR